MKLRDVIDMPDFNPATQQGRGDWGLRCVTSGEVATHPTWKVACIDHGAMNCVNQDRTLWRCLMCGRGAYALPS